MHFLGSTFSTLINSETVELAGCHLCVSYSETYFKCEILLNSQGSTENTISDTMLLLYRFNGC